MGRDEISRRCQREGIPVSRGHGQFIVQGGQSELLNCTDFACYFLMIIHKLISYLYQKLG